jgi:hypothetical protein
VLGLPPLGLDKGGGHRVLPRGSIEIDENGNVVEDNGVPLAAASALALQAAEAGAKQQEPPEDAPAPPQLTSKKPKTTTTAGKEAAA